MKTVEERFFEKVHINIKSGCWEWTAQRLPRGSCNMKSGYGMFHDLKQGVWKKKTSHRKSYEMFHGEIPHGKFVCHTCDNPCCVNPSHLFLASHGENMADMKKKGRSADKKGEKQGKSKLKSNEVVVCREFIKRHPPTISRKSIHYGSITFLARWFNIATPAMNQLVHGVNWSHIK